MEAALQAFIEGVPDVLEVCVSSVYGLLIARACALGEEATQINPLLPIAFAHAGDAIDKLHVGTRTIVVRYPAATIVQANAQPLVVTLRLAAGAPVDASLAQLPALLAALAPVRIAADEASRR